VRRGMLLTLAATLLLVLGVSILLSRRTPTPSGLSSPRLADDGGAPVGLDGPFEVATDVAMPTETLHDDRGPDSGYPGASNATGPIWTASEAIGRTLARFPPELDPHGETALLVTREELAYWSNDGASSADIPTPDRHAPSSHGPLWVVAVLATNLTPAVLMPGMMTDSRPADSAYFAWDANSGRLYEEGVPVRGQHQTYATLIALPTTDAPIRAATAVPMNPPVTPEPTASLSPPQLATIVAALTAQAIRYLTATPTP